MADHKLIGQRVKYYRKQSGLTQEQLAERVNISDVYLSRIENGAAKPTLDVYANICSTLRCDLSALFSNVSTESERYQSDRILELFQSCTPRVKPVVLDLLEKLSRLE